MTSFVSSLGYLGRRYCRMDLRDKLPLDGGRADVDTKDADLMCIVPGEDGYVAGPPGHQRPSCSQNNPGYWHRFHAETCSGSGVDVLAGDDDRSYGQRLRDARVYHGFRTAGRCRCRSSFRYLRLHPPCRSTCGLLDLEPVGPGAAAPVVEADPAGLAEA